MGSAPIKKRIGIVDGRALRCEGQQVKLDTVTDDLTCCETSSAASAATARSVRLRAGKHHHILTFDKTNVGQAHDEKLPIF